jgi:hypothetical protein
MAALLLVAVLALIGQDTRSTDGRASSATRIPDVPDRTTAPSSTIGVRDEVVARLHQIFRIRDKAIQNRNALLLEDIFTVDCPCLTGDRQLIQKLRQEKLLWRGTRVSISVEEVEQVSSRLWTISALVTTSSFDIVEESGAIIRRVPGGSEYSRFALARPVGQKNWLLGKASVIEERG